MVKYKYITAGRYCRISDKGGHITGDKLVAILKKDLSVDVDADKLAKMGFDHWIHDTYFAFKPGASNKIKDAADITSIVRFAVIYKKKYSKKPFDRPVGGNPIHKYISGKRDHSYYIGDLDDNYGFVIYKRSYKNIISPIPIVDGM